MDETSIPRVSDSVAEARSRSAAASYIALTKPKQTALLMATGIGAFLLSAGPSFDRGTFAIGMLALAAAVSGSTALNMVFDRDIDARMARTSARPLPASALSLAGALGFGLALALGGTAVALGLSPLFGIAVALGLVFDVGVYTIWLKRRTPLSILVGGISGGMPAVAGRALAIGSVDIVALLLAAGVVLWIPAHILTLAMKHADEYEQAGVPVWPKVFGEDSTRRLIAVATAGAAVVLVAAGVLEHVHAAALAILSVAGLFMFGLAASAFVAPSERRNWLLFKTASVYMLVAFMCLTVGAIL
jgi:protoheme IX farnesyltransferase